MAKSELEKRKRKPRERADPLFHWGNMTVSRKQYASRRFFAPQDIARSISALKQKQKELANLHPLVSQALPVMNPIPKFVEEFYEPKKETVGQLAGINYVVYYADKTKQEVRREMQRMAEANRAKLEKEKPAETIPAKPVGSAEELEALNPPRKEVS